MKTFSRLNLFTLVCLGFAVMLVGNTADAQDETSLEVVGATEVYEIGTTPVAVQFKAGTQDASGAWTYPPGITLKIESMGMNITSTVPSSGMTGPGGILTVNGIVTAEVAYVKATWEAEGLSAQADFGGMEPPDFGPVVIVVGSPDPKSPHKIGSTFTQMITIENRGEGPSLPLSAWQMDVVYNPSILKAVSVTEGDFLESDGADAAYAAMMSSGKVSVSQARAGQMANATPPPANVASAPSPAGIALAAGDTGALLTIEFEVLAYAEEALGIHNVQLQSDADEDEDGTADRISYSILVTDVLVATMHQSMSYAKEDVNQDEMVDLLDLMVVANSIGSPNGRADVNGDGFVNVLDLVVIYTSELWAGPAPATVDETWARGANEPALAAPAVSGNVDPAMIQAWIDLAQVEDDGSAIFDLGIANLEALLASRIPSETKLLLNYPNPFNPETWIPYQLAKATDVTVIIHSMNGSLIRTIELGHQAAGTYKSKNQAAYWDGRNEFGEQVASGLYFYTLTAGDFSATGKMLVRK